MYTLCFKIPVKEIGKNPTLNMDQLIMKHSKVCVYMIKNIKHILM